jgi:NADPH:quinone reductase
VKAIRQHAFGGPEELRVEEVPDPEPTGHQVRIAVEAAGVHFIDTTIRQGTSFGALPPPELPMTPGREVAGTVESAGFDVDPAWLGRRVVAHLGPANGGYAALAVVDVDEVFALPGHVDAAGAVAMVGTGRTTLGILEVAAIRPDDVVLITAAAGGIGSLLVQAARAAGATVVGAAGGPEKDERVKALGADVAVDYAEPGWAKRVPAVTVALDGVGGDLGRQALEAIAVGGRLVLFGYSSGSITELSAGDLFSRGLTASAAIGPRILQRPGGMRDLEERSLAAAADGSLVPAVHRFALADAAAAHAALEGRATTGKVVLIP